jgi:hypothetical protein
MSKRNTTDFIFGIAGNLVASLLVAIANILFGRFAPNAPREVLDIASLILPLTAILLLLFKNKIKKMIVELCLWITKIRKSTAQTLHPGFVKKLFINIFDGINQFIKQFFNMDRQMKKRQNLFEMAIKPSIIIVTMITVFVVVGFGVSIRWLYEQRTITTIPAVYSTYRQVYDLLTP